MTIEPLVSIPKSVISHADEPPTDTHRATAAPGDASSFAGTLGKAFGDASASLERADRSERAFARGGGGLQEMVLQRAQADVALSLASAAATRVSQALSTILGMQV